MRRPYIDWARGLAVLLMIHGHTLDAWTQQADRSTRAFQVLTLIGGFAAPLFLWLAGVGVVLAADRHGSNRSKAAEAAIKRGLEIFILAFLFRLQAFVVSPGSPLVTIFRVDILNILGLGLVMAGLVWGASRSPLQAGVVFALLAATTAVATPLVRSAGWVEAIPVWLGWYLRPMGDHTTFTGLPWWGFVFGGGAAGLAVAAAVGHRGNRPVSGGWVHALLALAGLGLVSGGLYLASVPSIYVHSDFWTSSPTYFAVRLGICSLVLSACYGLWRSLSRSGSGVARWTGPATGALERLGRSSLFIYWIHVELVYGTVALSLRYQLSLWQLELAFLAFSGVMYQAVLLRDRLVSDWPRFARIGRVTNNA